MSNVIPFRAKASKSASKLTAAEIERAVLAAGRTAADADVVLQVAEPLIERCRDRYGFTLMQPGLPTDAAELATTLVALQRGLCQLDAELRGNAPTWAFNVYLGRSRLQWFEDGYGATCALGVPAGASPVAIGRFVSERIAQRVARGA